MYIIIGLVSDHCPRLFQGWALAPGKTQQFLNSPIFHTKIKEIPLKNKSYISMLRAHTQRDPRKTEVTGAQLWPTRK